MKYIKLVLEYLIKFEKGRRFFLTALVALPFAVLAAFALPLDVYFGWFLGHEGQYESFGTLIESQLAGFNVYFFLGTIAAAILTVASITGMHNFCLRTGKFRIGNLLKGINDNFKASLQVTLYIMAILVIGSLVTAFFVYPIGLIEVSWLVKTLSIILVLVFGGMLTVIITNFILFMPIMTYNGTSFFRTFSLSIEKTQQASFKKLFFAVLTSVGAVFLIGFVSGLIKNRIAGIVLSIVAYDLVAVYLITLSVLTYFDVEGLEREDSPREYRYKKYEQ